MIQRSLSFFFPMVFVLASAALTDVAHAGRYELIKGKGVEVCEAYQKNLNSFKPGIPMICERQINPEMKDLIRPAWRKLDVWEHRALTRKVHELLGGPGLREDWEEGLKDSIKSGRVALESTQVDIDNDRKLENVIKYHDGDCPMHVRRGFSVALLVLGEDMKTIDIKSAELMQNPASSAGSTSAGVWGGAIFDVFGYKGKMYFDRWTQYPKQTNHLKVFLTEHGITKEVCRYHFTGVK